MQAIIPLAGPDFIRPGGALKALVDLDGAPLLRKVLASRCWAHRLQGKDYAFVLIDRPETRAFADGPLSDWYPGARKVFLSDFTRGAALSAVAGAAMHRTSEPVVVDLADILYSCDLDVEAAFAADKTLGGIALTFESDNPLYSYLEMDASGRFIRAAEKVVISRNASAGTYLFSSTSAYLRALAHALENENIQTHRTLFFVCPLFNGVKAAGFDVKLHPVAEVVDIKVAGDPTLSGQYTPTDAPSGAS